MTVAWMLYVLLVGALLAASAWCVEDALRAAKLPTRWLWTAALLGTVAFAAFALRGGNAGETTMPKVMASVATVSSQAAPASRGILAAIETLRTTAATIVASAMGAATARMPRDLVRLTLTLWAAASVALMLVHLAAGGRVIRMRRAWPITTLPGGTARVAPALGPAVIGLTSPEIVVPEWLLEKSREEQRLVMVHEQEHIAARDQYLPFGALLVATLLPWHPAVWWALARLRLAVELDCDARVLRRGERAKTYGALLIDIAARCGGHRVGAVALADRTSHLERRILAMTSRTSRFTRARSIGLAAVAALAIVTACEARLPTSAEVQSMDVASAEKAMVQSKLIAERSAANAIYIVDGVTVSAEKAHAIPSERIATVNIMKSPNATDGSAPATIKITTLYATKADLVKLDPGTEFLKQRTDTLPMRAKMNAERLDRVAFETRKDTMSRRKDSFSGLVFVDGVRAPSDVLSKLSKDEIATVEVMKGEAARKAYASDPAAANGVITITTKHAKQ